MVRHQQQVIAIGRVARWPEVRLGIEFGRYYSSLGRWNYGSGAVCVRGRPPGDRARLCVLDDPRSNAQRGFAPASQKILNKNTAIWLM